MSPQAVAVIPAWNEAEYIGEVVRGVRTAGLCPLVVDDGSDDGTGALALEAGAWLVMHPENLGKGSALRTGFAAATHFFPGAAVVTLDGDAQHDPQEIPSFLERHGRGDELVLGNRMANPVGMPLVRRWTNRFMTWLVRRRTGLPLHDTQCGYRLLGPKALEQVRFSGTRYDAETEMLIAASRLGLPCGEVPIRTIYRKGMKSGIRVARDTVRFLRVMLRGRARA